ncbi:hypothetical protein ERW51_14750 [Aliivibrio finisterrensis]|uniref:hypothetical protein n=1 Tax=Aliivibrio finisterrensis TaxID=511998 RepID=UPI001021D72E|nr:hypothetical protein [Aliivibrio finisterrensis]RYU65730.1 hypothetical protein ERW54_15460 [Aliivibrio finisterrensis]RYU69190.1 hypothetical protein ERW51_14750 [Aliivibrio finisterrensis]RYU72611.1 hypothetical protein ERW48_14765 [Aliivibrio finisterrensis]
MLFNKLKLSLAISSILALTACGGESDASPANSTKTAITTMSTVTEGFQTFKPRTHDLTGFTAISTSPNRAAPLDDGVSEYVYENPETGEVSSVVFEGEDKETEEAQPKPTIVTIVDLNDTYSAINMHNTAVEINGEILTGNYTVIQNKTTGRLYPLVENGQPIYKIVDAEHEAWVTNTRFSHNGDTQRIYLRHGETKSLHKAELSEGLFVISKVFDDYERYDVILPNGDIVSKPWTSNEPLIWREQNGTEHSLAYNTELSPPFLHDGKLFAINQANNNAMVELMLNETVLEQIDSGWTINGYLPSSRSVVRGNYKMHSDCSVYEFNTITKTIKQLEAPKSNSGYVANAAQNALYCMFADADDDTALPKFFRFAIDKAIANQPATTTVHAASGTKLDANERMAVISDNELMFYQYPNGTFTEYYVNFDAGTTIVKQVETVTAIKMQTIKAD